MVGSSLTFRIRGTEKFGDLLKQFGRSRKEPTVPFSWRALENTIGVETSDI